MDLNELARHATDDELRTLAAVAGRAAAAPRIVVTVKVGKGTRRYVVCRDSEDVFDGIDNAEQLEEKFGHMGAILASFGCQWLRGKGRVDECYRTLSMCEVVKIKRQQEV